LVRLSWIGRFADALLYEPATPVRPIRPAPLPFPVLVHADPLETQKLLSGADAGTVERVCHSLEAAKALGWMSRRHQNIDEALAHLRVHLRRTQPRRVPTVARLVWRSVEPLLGDAETPCAWTVPREVLPLAYAVATTYDAENRLLELSRELAAQILLGDDTPPAVSWSWSLPPQILLNIERQARSVVREALDLACRDPAFDLKAAGVFAQLPTLARPMQPPRFKDVLRRLAQALYVTETRCASLHRVAARATDLASRPGWRMLMLEIDALEIEVASAMAHLLDGCSEDGPTAAGAYLVLASRLSRAPWPILESLRRRVSKDHGGSRMPLDSQAGGEVGEFLDDLVEAIEHQAGLVQAELQGRSLHVAEPAIELAVMLHGILGSGFLDVAGERHRRVLAAREAVGKLFESHLLQVLKRRILDPAALDDPELGRSARRAARDLRDLHAAPDGFRLSGVVARAVRDVVIRLECKADACFGPGAEADRAALNEIRALLAELHPAALDQFDHRVARKVAAIQ